MGVEEDYEAMERESECQPVCVCCLLWTQESARRIRMKIGKEEEEDSGRSCPFCDQGRRRGRKKEEREGGELGEDGESIAVLTERIFVCT